MTLCEFVTRARLFGVRVGETRSDNPRRFLVRATEFGDFYAVPHPWNDDELLDAITIKALCVDLGITPRDFDEDLDRLA